MNIEQFAIKTTTLEQFYNKSLNATQKQIWFDELKGYDIERYEKAITFMCKNNQYMPTLSQVLEVMKKGNIYAMEVKPKVACELCKGTGYVLYKEKIKDNEYTFACLCNCENAKGLEYDGMKIADKEHRQPFYIRTAEEVFKKSL
jgi:hypothetical protein